MTSLLLRLKRFCGILFGIVFFLSGLVKLMDPVGAELVMKEYYDFLHIGFMAPTAKFFGVTLALIESLTGAALVCGVWRRIVGMIAICIQSAFTLLTLLILIINPEMDCGCFGEAIHLTHAQTFIKNLILLSLILLYYIPRKHLGETRGRKYVSFGIVSASVAGFMIYSLLYIPLIDFTAYKPGAELLYAGTDGGDDIYEATFVYQKDGKIQEFKLNELPDSTWSFVSTQTRTKSNPDNSAIELSIFNPRTQTYADSLAVEGKVIVISAYSPEIKPERWAKIRILTQQAQKSDVRPIILAPVIEDVPEDLRELAYTCDYKTLISLNRSNGGATYFDNGTLVKKWAGRDLPDSDGIKKISTDDSTETAIDYESKGSLGFQGFLLYALVLLLL